MIQRLMILMLLVSAGGCAGLNPFGPRRTVHQEVLPDKEWEKLKRENQVRLAGEGIPASHAATRPVGAVDGFVETLTFVFWDMPRQAIDYYILGNTPGKYARLMEDDQSADLRRQGVLNLVTRYPFARVEPYTKRYWQIAQGDPDYLVRVAAIRALNRSRDRSVVPVAIKALDHPNALLRLEAAKALANLPDDRALAGLSKHLGPEIELKNEQNRTERLSEDRDVRVACADALRNFANKDAAKALIDTLNEKNFEIAWQSRKSLTLLTGRDFRYDQARWRDYINREARPFGP